MEKKPCQLQKWKKYTCENLGEGDQTEEQLNLKGQRRQQGNSSR